MREGKTENAKHDQGKSLICTATETSLGIWIESERESRIDSCVECCVRDRDFSKKKVYRCDLCDRWFCEKHFEPRLAFIKDLDASEKIPEISALYHTEVEGKEDGHPDFEYSRRKLAELDIEEKRRSALKEEALNRMNTHYRMKSGQGTEESEKEENIVRRALPEEKSENGIISEARAKWKNQVRKDIFQLAKRARSVAFDTIHCIVYLDRHRRAFQKF